MKALCCKSREFAMFSATTRPIPVFALLSPCASVSFLRVCNSTVFSSPSAAFTVHSHDVLVDGGHLFNVRIKIFLTFMLAWLTGGTWHEDLQYCWPGLLVGPGMKSAVLLGIGGKTEYRCASMALQNPNGGTEERFRSNWTGVKDPAPNDPNFVHCRKVHLDNHQV